MFQLIKTIVPFSAAEVSHTKLIQ